jgi:hypothetical protein
MVVQERAIWCGYRSVAGNRGVFSGTRGKSNSLQSLALAESQAVKMNSCVISSQNADQQPVAVYQTVMDSETPAAPTAASFPARL